jgi:hypothetical protein
MGHVQKSSPAVGHSVHRNANAITAAGHPGRRLWPNGYMYNITDARTWRELGRALGGAPFFPEYLLVRHRAAIVAMVQPYFRFASAAWRLTPEDLAQISPGYSLLFLVHAVALDAPSLGLDRYERLVELYHRVDYPEDRHAAQRVAGELLAVLDRPRGEA